MSVTSEMFRDKGQETRGLSTVLEKECYPRRIAGSIREAKRAKDVNCSCIRTA